MTDSPPVHHTSPHDTMPHEHDANDGHVDGWIRSIHHADGSLTVVEDWYDYIFDHGQIGDWWWSQDTDGHRILWLVVPDPRTDPDAARGPQVGGGEMLLIYPSHAGPSADHPTGNWAQPGPVNGWDGNEDAPTLSPSIFPGGRSDAPGWHGFFKAGQLETVG